MYWKIKKSASWYSSKVILISDGRTHKILMGVVLWFHFRASRFHMSSLTRLPVVVPCFTTRYTVNTRRRARYECYQRALLNLRRRVMGWSRNLTPRECHVWVGGYKATRSSFEFNQRFYWYSMMTSLTQRLHSPGKGFLLKRKIWRRLSPSPHPTTCPFNPLVENLPADYANHNDNSPGFSVSEVVFLSPFSLPPSLSSWLVFHPTSFDSKTSPSIHETK